MTRGVTHMSYTIRAESAGNATITTIKGEPVAVLEDWTLFVDGQRIGDVDSYHHAMKLTESIMDRTSCV